MNDEELRFIDQRLTKLETKFEERWCAHEKRYDEIFLDLRSTLKDLGLKFQIMQERFLSQHENCMKEVDKKINDTDARHEKKIEGSEKKMWKITTIILVAIPSIMYVIYQTATFIIAVSTHKGTP